MQIRVPGILQSDFEYAVECLEVCKQDGAPKDGFHHPYFMPGGAYGKQWWQLDSSLALCGYKWIDRAFCETSLWNFIESQKEDGRICLWGADRLPSEVAGGNVLGQTENASSLPKLFDVAYHLLQGSTDEKLKAATYEMLKNYVDLWFINRQDKKTGLITAVFEETFIPYLGYAGEYAPVDTNVEVYVGCHYTELLAAELGKTGDAEEIERRKRRLKQSINQYLWNEERGAYFPYSVKDEKMLDCLMVSTFFPFRMQIAGADRRKRLIELLKNQEHFNWDVIPLTSVSMKDSCFVTTKGAYQGNASWSGNVWSLLNEMVVRGLCDCGEDDLAAELALKTIYAFNHNCTEFLNPFDGVGHGVVQYAWTASQYIELLIEIVFGISYDAKNETLRIAPRITKEMQNERLEIKKLQIAEQLFADILIENDEISYKLSNESIKVIVRA